MDNQYPSKRPLLKNKILRILAIELSALLVSLSFIAGFGYFFLCVNSFLEKLNIVVLDELFFLFFSVQLAIFLSSFFISFPIAVLIHIYFFKKFFFGGEFKIFPHWKKMMSSVFFAVIIALITPFLLFWYEESRRARLIARYEAPHSLIEDLIKKDKGHITEIMHKDEVFVCAIDAYDRVDRLSMLSIKQKASLPKGDLPSESLAWYLLFFDNDAISRIYFMDNYPLGARVDGIDAECVNRDGYFMVRKVKDSHGNDKLVLHISQRSQE